MLDELSSDLKRSVHGEAWHGPSLFEALEGVTASQAAARPIAGAHTIWELVLHVTAWMEEVACRLEGDYHREPLAGDWPAVAKTSAEAWSQTPSELERALSHLTSAVSAFPPARLDERVGGASQPMDITFAGMLRGLAQHNAYHTGQIRLLRTLFGSRSGSLSG